MAIQELKINTGRQGLYEITDEISGFITKNKISEGICVVFTPHTTAGITINENADPDVVRDILFGLEKAFPDRKEFIHSEGNSAAHLKASCVGSSVNIIITNGKLMLGTWQGIYFCEFDGPRSRKVTIKVIVDADL
ncbi:MAG: YjbQ family protein [Eubacteriaceae bacterium]|nr:YjbQ family protein [Eubacteriaceae bacterium]